MMGLKKYLTIIRFCRIALHYRNGSTFDLISCLFYNKTCCRRLVRFKQACARSFEQSFINNVQPCIHSSVRHSVCFMSFVDRMAPTASGIIGFIVLNKLQSNGNNKKVLRDLSPKKEWQNQNDGNLENRGKREKRGEKFEKR